VRTTRSGAPRAGGIARRLTLRRDAIPLERLLAFGSEKRALGIRNAGHPRRHGARLLRGVAEADVQRRSFMGARPKRSRTK
jgi:hypothetical protein